MFSGRPTCTATVTSVSESDSGTAVALSGLASPPRAGDAVLLAGIAGTVSAAAGGTTVEIPASEHSLAGVLRAGANVNVEVGGGAGWHLVRGRPDAVCRVADVLDAGKGFKIAVLSLPAEKHARGGKHGKHSGDLRAELQPGAYVAVDGVALCAISADHEAGTVAVALSPETCHGTTLGKLEKGGEVALECDAVARHVREELSAPSEEEGGDARDKEGKSGAKEKKVQATALEKLARDLVKGSASAAEGVVAAIAVKMVKKLVQSGLQEALKGKL
ncbi:hypothetical protein DFJ74DRAFT_671608 [Hyaloraphidium curvatum]|nr:hypothetical protein DFJ74DRAFT_671608 [Hyaloraphidium curvatum]